MKKYLIYSAITIFSFSAALTADPNEPNSIAEPNSITEPNDLEEPNFPAAITKTALEKAPPNRADIKKSGPGIMDPVKLMNQLKRINETTSNEPNEPNVPAPVPVAPVKRKLPDTISVKLSAAVELPQFKYRMLPLQTEKTDTDAAEFYLKAIDTLPAGFSLSATNALLDQPIDKFDSSAATAIVNSSAKSLDHIAAGALSRKCQWKTKSAGKGAFSLLEGLNGITAVVALKARLDISAGQYKTAVKTIRNGLAMSRHIANTPSTIQSMAGANTASLMLKCTEELIQSPNAPSLYRSLQDLPRPLVRMDMLPTEIKSEPIKEEFGRYGPYGGGPGFGPGMPGMSSEEFGSPGGMDDWPAFEAEFGNEPKRAAEESSHTKKEMLLQMNKLDRLVAALQCIEGIRYYAAINNGKLPASLSDISDLSIPVDPVTRRPFRYRLYPDKALLGSPVTDKQSDNQSTIFFIIKARSASAGINNDQVKD